jgi:hypothetical protein
MGVHYFFMTVSFFTAFNVFSMDKTVTPTPPPSPRRVSQDSADKKVEKCKQKNSNHKYYFPAPVTEHVYPITRYLPCTRPHATQRKSLGVPRHPDPDHIGAFFIYTASRSSRFENPWYCLNRLQEDQSMRDHVAVADAAREEQQIVILMNLLPDDVKNLCTGAPLSLKRKIETFELFLSDAKKAEYKRACCLQTCTINYSFLTKDELALCDKTLHTFTEFLSDINGEMKIGPILIYFYQIADRNEVIKLPYALEKISQDYAENSNSDFTQPFRADLLRYWPDHSTKKQLLQAWKTIKYERQ